MEEPVLRVENLVVRFGGRRGGLTVIDDVSSTSTPVRR
jgi:hypothetical protein